MSVSDRRADLVVVVGVLIALNLATAFLLDSWPEAVIQIAVALAVVGFALRRGYSAAALGLSRAALGAGVRLGAALSAVIVVVVLAAVPVGRGFLEDERFTDMSGWSVLYELLVRIPIITALSEELLFRSVLLTVLLGMLTTTWSVLWCSLGFGAWHILTTVGDLIDNATTESLDWPGQIGAVFGIVAVTATAGAVFAWTRLRSSSIVAPWMIHTTLNGATFAAGLIVAP